MCAFFIKYFNMYDDDFIQRPKHVALYHSVMFYKHVCDLLLSSLYYCYYSQLCFMYTILTRAEYRHHLRI
jgi:hypothetical protein